MALGEVTDSKAVIVAIAEFDDVGRDAFLKKYGFSKARSYFIRSDGRRYDSKAIVGAARGYQHPQVGPLSAQEFSGGEAAAVRVLRKLGFEVLKLGGPSRAPRYWAFCANPRGTRSQRLYCTSTSISGMLSEATCVRVTKPSSGRPSTKKPVHYHGFEFIFLTPASRAKRGGARPRAPL